MVSAEQDAEVIGVEHLCEILLHRLQLIVVRYYFTYVHGRVEREALDEEHRVLQSVLVRAILELPKNAHFLLAALGDKAAVRHDLVIDRRRGVDTVRDRAGLARILDLKLGPVATVLHHLEDELALRKHVDKVRADIDGAVEGILVLPSRFVV